MIATTDFPPCQIAPNRCFFFGKSTTLPAPKKLSFCQNVCDVWFNMIRSVYVNMHILKYTVSTYSNTNSIKTYIAGPCTRPHTYKFHNCHPSPKDFLFAWPRSNTQLVDKVGTLRCPQVNCTISSLSRGFSAITLLSAEYLILHLWYSWYEDVSSGLDFLGYEM